MSLSLPVCLSAVLAASLLASPMRAEVVDLSAIGKIRNEGLNRSQVMSFATHLSDDIGPRLTGSPQLAEAQRWAVERFTEMGLKKARNEPWGTFGRGWSFTRAAVHMTKPQAVPLLALPKGWSPGTEGPVRGTVVAIKVDSEKDLEPWKGKLAGKIVLLDDMTDSQRPAGALPQRYDDDDLEELVGFPIPAERVGDRRERARSRIRLRRTLYPFLAEEGVVATIERSSRQWGLVRVGGTAAFGPGEHPGVPALVMAAEHYARLTRLLDRKIEVELEVEIAARFHDEDLKGYNTVAEIPGSDPKGEFVLVGAHIDSWHAGQGATDNAAGVAVVMEAARILKALDFVPRRTIRFVLWSGEEQGLLGSRAYVENHFAARKLSDDPAEAIYPRQFRKSEGPLVTQPEHTKLSAYFNLDIGSGKIRGIYGQENAAALPIFESWFAPLADLGAKTVTMRGTSATDHVPFDAVGLPAFQFIQEPLDYISRTHHTNLDTLEHVEREDLMQASVVMASFAYNAAMRPERMPRNAMPKD